MGVKQISGLGRRDLSRSTSRSIATSAGRREEAVTQLGHVVMSTAVLLREEHFPSAFLQNAA